MSIINKKFYINKYKVGQIYRMNNNLFRIEGYDKLNRVIIFSFNTLNYTYILPRRTLDRNLKLATHNTSPLFKLLNGIK